MTLKLSIQEDGELRQYIKDLIRGQVISILRGEMKEFIGVVITTNKIVEKAAAKDGTMNDIIRKEVATMIKTEIGRKSSYGTMSYIIEIMREEVGKLLIEQFKKMTGEKNA